MISIIEAGLCESFSVLPEYFHVEPDVSWFMVPSIPIRSLNGVFNSKLPNDSSSCQNRIEQISAPFRSARVPFTWFVTPSCTPSNLGACLEKQGFRYDGEDPGMALDLSELIDMPVPEGLIIKRVENEEMLEQWSDAFAKVYHIRGEMMKISRTFHEACGYAANAKVQHFIGILDSEIVATSRLTFVRDTVYLSGLAVLENHRQKGIGAAMTVYPLHLAEKRDCEFAVLGSSKMALSLYEKLGFREYCKIRSYSGRFQ